MHKFFKVVILALLLVFTIQQAAVASAAAERPSKPTEGVEAFDPKHGISTETGSKFIDGSDLLHNYYCSIDNTGTDLYLAGTTVANYISDQVSLTLYLQKWDGSQWVDIKSWSFSKYNLRSITEGANASYQEGNYYRVRAVHYVKFESQTETKNSTSSYIYIEE